MPIAHGLVGATMVCVAAPTAVKERRIAPLVIGALLAIIPDLDFFFEWVLGWHDVHRTATHSLTVAALLAAVLFWRMNGHTRLAVGYALAFASHTLLDFAASKFTPGVTFFWPFSTTYYKLGVVGISEIDTGLATWGAVRESFGQLLVFCVVELVVFAPLFAFTYFIIRSATARQPATVK